MAVKSGSACKLYRSTDGLTWSLTTTVNTLVTLTDIAAIGRVWVGVLSQGGTFPHWLVYSLDTINWYMAQSKLPEAGTSPARVRSNGVQAGALHDTGVRFTLVQGPASAVLT